MTSTEFNKASTVARFQYLITKADKNIIDYLIQKNRNTDLSEVTYRTRVNKFLVINGPMDSIFEITSVLSGRGVNYIQKGMKSVEVEMADFINRLS